MRTLTVGGRDRGGRRPGHAKAFTTQVGTAAARRVNHLARLGKATLVVGDDVFSSTEDVEDTFQRGNSDFLGADWIKVTGLADGNDGWANQNDNAWAPIDTNEVVIDPTGLGAATTGQIGAILHNGQTANNVFSRWRIAPDADTTNQNNILATTREHRCYLMGPVIRVDENGTHGITAMLKPIDATHVHLKIYQIAAGGDLYTELATSVSLTISGGGQEGAAGDTGTDSLELDLEDFGGYVVATARWANQVGTDSKWDEISISATTSDYNGDHLSGVIVREDTDAVGTDTRTLGYLKVERYVPDTPVTLIALDGDDSPGANRYQLPAGWTGITHSVDGLSDDVFEIDGLIDEAARTAEHDFPMLDTNDLRIETVLTADIDSFIIPTAALTSAHNVQFYPDSSAYVTLAAFFRISDDRKSYLRVTVTGNGGSSWENEFRISAISIHVIADGAAPVLLDTITRSVAVNAKSWVSIIDARTGDGELDTTIRITSEGRTLYEWSPAAGELTDLDLKSFTVGLGAPPSTEVRLEGIRIIVGEESATGIPDKITHVMAVTTTAIHAGRLDSATMTAVTGPNLANRMVSSFAANNQWYAVDGATSLIIDPIALTSAVWEDQVLANGAGELPSACRLACLWRGCGVLARQPDNASIWFISRIGDLLDYDYGADPTATAAMAGTSALVGLPGDELTALIPRDDDYLIFGGATSIWMLQGDPRYGGTMTRLSDVTGIAQAHAWTWDHMGNLWFMGNSGLYRMRKGEFIPVLMSGRGLRELLDKVDFDNNIISLACDLFRKEIVVYITPADDSSIGVHIICAIDSATTDPISWWADEYPAVMGPTAAATMPLPADADRRPLLGGRDGYIRRQADDAYDDDGTAISSFLRYAPMELGGGMIEAMISTIHAELGADSADLAWAILVGNNAEAVNAMEVAAATVSGTFTAGYNSPQSARARGGALGIYLSHADAGETWSLEKLRVWLTARGQRR